MGIMVGSCAETREQESAQLESALTRFRGLRVRRRLAGCRGSGVARPLRGSVERLHELEETFAHERAASFAPAALEHLQRLDRA
jgi:hypothetical protein